MMWYLIIVEKSQNLIRGLIDKNNTYSAKRWTGMWIIFVLLALTIVDFIFNDFVLREWLVYAWIGVAVTLFGQTLLDKRMDKKTEIEISKNYKSKNDEPKDQ